MILDPVPTPEEALLEREDRLDVSRVLLRLMPREERAVRLRIGLNCDETTLDAIAASYGVSRERIRQIEAKAFRKLRHPSSPLRRLMKEGRYANIAGSRVAERREALAAARLEAERENERYDNIASQRAWKARQKLSAVEQEAAVESEYQAILAAERAAWGRAALQEWRETEALRAWARSESQRFAREMRDRMPVIPLPVEPVHVGVFIREIYKLAQGSRHG